MPTPRPTTVVNSIFASGRGARLQRGHGRAGRAAHRPGRARHQVHAPARPRQRAAVAGRPLRRVRRTQVAWTYTTIQFHSARQGDQLDPGHRGGLDRHHPGGRVDPHASTTCSRSTTSSRRWRWSTRALLTAGVLLLLLIAALTWLLTRQIVTPIRLARRVAERLAAGQLQERLRVTGEDDLARLATSFNQMATNLQRQIRQLEELSRVQRRFVSDVSHELRTPLTTVRLAGSVLHDARDGFDPPTATGRRAAPDASWTGSRRCWSTCSRSAASTPAPPRSTSTTSNLTDVVRRVVDSTRALADAAQHPRSWCGRPRRPCVAEADVRRVERIVRNLVTNAIDHAESSEIVVTVAADDQAAAIAVRDHGVGLAVGESAMVFNRFWRADPARARTSGGTGLGLAISLEDTHLHGGWLQAWGKPNEGAQFRLTLPRHAGHPLRHSPLPLVPDDAAEVVA